MDEQEPKRKNWKKRMVCAVLIFIPYWIMGTFVAEWVDYAYYHPRSTASRILFPTSPLLGQCPFSSDTPEINPEPARKYESYEEYRDATKIERIIITLLWPIALFVFWTIAAGSWIAWLVVWLFKYLFCGGLLRQFGLIP